MTIKTVLPYLTTHDIAYTLHEHPAVNTCEEADKHCGDIPGLACKNLFLKDRKSRRFFLIILPATKKADFKKIAETLNEKKVSFASAEELKEKLGLEPGSVSPFGLLNDKNHKVELYIDQELYDADIVSFHPNTNTATIELTNEMFHKFLKTLKNNIAVI